MKKRIFILGISGLTGTKLQYKANEFEVFGSYNLRNQQENGIKRIKIDVSNSEKIERILREIKPDVLINTSGINNVDYCETHHEEVKKINVDAVKDISEITKDLQIKLIHLSTDSVFNGKKDSPYTEEDIPDPINYYGKTKMLSEKIVLENPENLVIRTSVLYGWLPKTYAKLPSSSLKPVNFAQWLIEKLLVKDSVKIITDELDSPIIAEDFAKSIIHLLKLDKSGIFHSAPPIQISRYDFSVKLAKMLDLDDKLIQPILNKDLGREIATGKNKCLDSTKMSKETGFNFLTLDDSLKMLKQQIK